MTVARLRQPRPTVPEWAKPWIDSFELYLDAAGRSHYTVSRYVDFAGWFAGWLTTAHPTVDDWGKVRHKAVQEFLRHLQKVDGAGYSRKYVHDVGQGLQQFFKWLAMEEECANPMDRVAVPGAPKLGEEPPPTLALTQLTALLKDAESGRDYMSRRDTALLRIFACTGGRLSELASLRVEDIDKQTREVRVRGKGNKVRVIKFDHKCALAIDRYLRVRARRPHAYLPGLWLGVRQSQAMTSSGIRQVIERRGRNLGLKLWPHLFRHTFADYWLTAGGEEGDLLEIAGWESTQMLRLYGRSGRSARARTAYDRVNVLQGV